MDLNRTWTRTRADPHSRVDAACCRTTAYIVVDTQKPRPGDTWLGLETAAWTWYWEHPTLLAGPQMQRRSDWYLIQIKAALPVMHPGPGFSSSYSCSPTLSLAVVRHQPVWHWRAPPIDLSNRLDTCRDHASCPGARRPPSPQTHSRDSLILAGAVFPRLAMACASRDRPTW